jgi:hypothetical protein
MNCLKSSSPALGLGILTCHRSPRIGNDKSARVRRSADRWVEADFKWRDQCSAGNEERSSRNTGIAVRTLIAGRSRRTYRNGDFSGTSQAFQHFLAFQYYDGMTRRQFFQAALGWSALSKCTTANAAAGSLHCTPAPSFSVPLSAGVWRSQEFPVGKHDYHVWLEVDRRMPLERLDCDLGPPRPGHSCNTPPLLDLEWSIFDGATLVRNWPTKPIKADAWSQASTSCLLGNFEGKRNGRFTLELNVKADAGGLKDLHPRVQIVKNPGYWCWL